MEGSGHRAGTVGLGTLVVLFALVPTVARAVEPGDEVVLRLDDGRVVRGILDSDPESPRIVLSANVDGIALRSTFAADHVLAILDAAEFDRDNNTIVVAREVGAREDSSPPDDSRPAPRVRSLSIAASVANWDADPETDGLLVHVVPVDDNGEIAPVDGTLNFELTLQQFSTKRQLPWRRRELPFFTSDRWSVPLRRDDFGLHGAYVRLPFRRLHPDIDLDVAPNALLRGRLGVRGQGVFEASDANVRIRPLSRFRDELEQLTGQRFDPRERVGRWPSSPSSRLRTFP